MQTQLVPVAGTLVGRDGAGCPASPSAPHAVHAALCWLVPCALLPHKPPARCTPAGHQAHPARHAGPGAGPRQRLPAGHPRQLRQPAGRQPQHQPQPRPTRTPLAARQRRLGRRRRRRALCGARPRVAHLLGVRHHGHQRRQLGGERGPRLPRLLRGRRHRAAQLACPGVAARSARAARERPAGGPPRDVVPGRGPHAGPAGLGCRPSLRLHMRCRRQRLSLARPAPAGPLQGAAAPEECGAAAGAGGSHRRRRRCCSRGCRQL